MLRVSTTDLDTFRDYLEDDEFTVEDLLRRLRRQSQPTVEMMAGRAFHKAMETVDYGTTTRFQQDGFTFVLKLDTEIELTELTEFKADKVYQVGGELVRVVGKVDGLWGKRVDDFKSTGRLDVERLFGGYQWRFYLDIFDADLFRWHVFEMAEDAREPSTFNVFAHHKLEQHRYPDMRADCERLLGEYLTFVKDHIPERLAPAQEIAA